MVEENGYETSRGGAIGNSSRYADNVIIEKITGDFIGNHAIANNSIVARGGAISNSSTLNTVEITDIQSNFINNYVQATYGTANGGAIVNVAFNADSISKLGNITGDFSGNYASSITGVANGGAISNDNFAGYNIGETTIGTISRIFTANHADSGGSNVYGGAIANVNTVINEIKDFTFNNNYTKTNSGYSYGGAIYNTGDINEIINSSFKNNYVETASGEALGGAIYTLRDQTITADNGQSIFSGNYTNSAGTIEQNAIYVAGSSSTLSLNAINNGEIVFDDTINGIDGYSLELTGDDSGKITFNNLVQNADVSLDTTTLNIGVTDTTSNTSNVFANSTLTANSGNITTADGSYTNYNIEKLTSSDDVRYSIDLSLSPEEQKADTFTVGAGSSGTIYLSSFNVENTSGDNEKYILQIIKAEDDSVQLDYDNSKVLQWAEAVMTSDMILAKDFGLYTTDTTNDSLIIRGLQDSLAEWAELIQQKINFSPMLTIRIILFPEM